MALSRGLLRDNKTYYTRKFAFVNSFLKFFKKVSPDGKECDFVSNQG